MASIDKEMKVRTRVKPGVGLASVLTMTESMCIRSVDGPLTFRVWRIGRDHTPLAPPTAWSLRFVRVGKSRCIVVSYFELKKANHTELERV